MTAHRRDKEILEYKKEEDVLFDENEEILINININKFKTLYFSS